MLEWLRSTALSTRILLGLSVGMALGLFLGELAAPLQEVGDAYVGLLQMTVLPYVAASLLGNIARLSLDSGKRLMRASVLTLSALWAVGLLAIPLLAQAFPVLETGAFYSTSMIEGVDEVDYLERFIPSNPFHALANNLVPAVALFCIAGGIAAIRMPNKQQLVDALDVLTELLMRMNRIVVQLSPIGIFAIAASAAGTLTLEQFGLLQGYLLTHTLGVGLLAFGALPLMAAAVTPLRYGEVLNAARAPMLTAFATGSTFVVLPMVVDEVGKLLESRQLDAGEVHADVVVPLAYPFPHLGKVIALLFVPFAAWFYGSPMGAADYPGFLASGLLGAFGGMVVTIPVLLAQLQLPSDAFQLFLLAGVYAARVSDVLGAMHLTVFSIIAICAVAGHVELRKRRIAIAFATIAIAAAISIGGTRTLISHTFADGYARQEVVDGMELMEQRVAITQLDQAAPNPVPLAPGQSRIERIRARGALRVGVHADHLPFSFRNSRGRLVGFDVDMAQRLAMDLGVELELVPLDVEHMLEQLDADHFDLVMAGIEGTLGRSETMALSEPYLDVHAALVVRDHRVDEFSTVERVRDSLEPLAVAQGGRASENVHNHVENRIIELGSVREFFEGDCEAEALITTAEVGAAWTLRHPHHAVVQPLARAVAIPLVYPIAGRDDTLRVLVNRWLDLHRRDGTIAELYDYWVLGRGATDHQPRWSIARDVLGWVD